MKELSAFEAKRVQRSLEYILKYLEVQNSTRVDLYPPVRVEIAVELLIEDLLGDEFVSEITKRVCVKKAIERFLKYKKYKSARTQVESFQKACEVELRDIKRNCSKFSILMFLNINTSAIENYREFNILGNTFYLKNFSELNFAGLQEAWVWLDNDTSRNNILTNIGNSRSLPSPPYFFPTEMGIYSVDINTALETAIEKFNLLRCFFNIPLIHQNIKPVHAGFRELSRVKPSPYYIIFDESGNFLRIYFNIEKYDYKTIFSLQNQFKVVNHLLPQFANPLSSKSSLEHFRLVLLLYQKALDTNDFSASYLAYWRVLEKCVTFGNERISFEEINKRISHLCSFDSMIKDILDIAVDKRNRFVHFGEYPELAEHHKFYRITQLLAEHSLNELYKLVQAYPKRQQISKYIEFLGNDKADLIKTKSIIDDILENKNPESQ